MHAFANEIPGESTDQFIGRFTRLRARPTDPAFQRDLEDVLGKRIAQACLRHGFRSIGEIACCTESDFLAVRNLGSASVRTIFDRIPYRPDSGPPAVAPETVMVC